MGAATAGHAASGACRAHDGAAAVRLSAAVPHGAGHLEARGAPCNQREERFSQTRIPASIEPEPCEGAPRRLGIPETADDPKTETSAAQPPFSKRGNLSTIVLVGLGASKKAPGFLGDGHVM